MNNKKYIEETKKLRNALEQGFFSLGERLYKIRTEKLYEGQYESFSEFVIEGMKMTESTASRLITVYQTFVLEYKMDESKIAEVGWNLLYNIGRIVSTKSEALEFINKAKVMTNKDIDSELREFKYGKDCPHQWSELHLRICSKCGQKEKIYETS